jgi:hypothetical protein
LPLKGDGKMKMLECEDCHHIEIFYDREKPAPCSQCNGEMKPPTTKQDPVAKLQCSDGLWPELGEQARAIYDKGFNTMKEGVKKTFEEVLEIKPEISAKELFELMKEQDLV